MGIKLTISELAAFTSEELQAELEKYDDKTLMEWSCGEMLKACEMIIKFEVFWLEIIGRNVVPVEFEQHV